MSGLWQNNPETLEGKYLVQRRDGTIPEWPYFVIAAADPIAPSTIMWYADEAKRLGMDDNYVSDLRGLAREFLEWRERYGSGDPDAPPHRVDDPKIIELMQKAKGC